MVDIRLDKDGDIMVSPVGDISLTESVRQAVLIRLRWIYQEWRLGPEMGFPWFEEIFVKNPNTVKIRSLIRDEILQVEGGDGSSGNIGRLRQGKEGRHLQVHLLGRRGDLQGGGDDV